MDLPRLQQVQQEGSHMGSEGGREGGGKERRRGNRGRERRMDKGRGEVREGYKVTSATMSLLFKELLDV